MAEKEKKQKIEEKPINTPLAELKKNQIETFDELETYKKVRQKRKHKAVVQTFVWLLIILIMPIFIFTAIVIMSPRTGHNFFGYTFYVVSSESMKPVFDKDDCIVVKKIKSRDELKVGTDISFIRASDGQIVTHRIIGVVENEHGEIEYITKGVHNTNADYGTVSYGDIIGKRVAVLSALGHVILFFRTSAGIVTFLAIFVLMVGVFGYVIRRLNDIRAVGA